MVFLYRRLDGSSDFEGLSEAEKVKDWEAVHVGRYLPSRRYRTRYIKSPFKR
jgi:hypothetical protein